MKDKFERIYNKAYQTKCLSTIKQYFVSNTSNETWHLLEEQITKKYLIIPNINMWCKDFTYGGSENVYLVPSMFEPYTHNRSVKQHNTFNGGIFGDVMTLLRSFNDYHASCINLVDFGLFIQILSIMVVYSFFRERQARINGTNMNFEIAMFADWFIRQTVAQLTIPEENSHVVYNLHFQNSIECSCFGEVFNEVMKNFTKYSKAKVWASPEFYKNVVVGSYFEFIGNMKLKDGFVGPNLIYHESVCTPMQQAILTSDKFKSTYEAMQYLQLYGISETAKKFNIEEKDNTTEELFAYNNYVEYTYNIIHSRKTVPDHVYFVQDNPCNVDYSTLTQTPIASCTVDVDKLMYENSTKSIGWSLQTIEQLYSNAQTINRLRTEFQSEHKERPLLVTLILSDKEFIEQEQIIARLDSITSTIRSVYEYDFKYKITGGKNG